MRLIKIKLDSNDAAVIEKYARKISGSAVLLDEDFFQKWTTTFLALTADTGLASKTIEAVEVEWPEEWLWEIRDIVPYTEKMGEEPTGAALHRKIYQALSREEESQKPYTGDVSESVSEFLEQAGEFGRSIEDSDEPNVSDADEPGHRNRDAGDYTTI